MEIERRCLAITRLRASKAAYFENQKKDQEDWGYNEGWEWAVDTADDAALRRLVADRDWDKCPGLRGPPCCGVASYIGPGRGARITP